MGWSLVIRKRWKVQAGKRWFAGNNGHLEYLRRDWIEGRCWTWDLWNCELWWSAMRTLMADAKKIIKFNICWWMSKTSVSASLHSMPPKILLFNAKFWLDEISSSENIIYNIIIYLIFIIIKYQGFKTPSKSSFYQPISCQP